MSRLTLVNAMFRGTEIDFPMTDGHGMIRGRVQGMMREDGSGHSWILTISQCTPFGHRYTKLYMRTQPGSYACRMLESKRSFA